MSNEEFFEGFLAALRLLGQESVLTEDDEHHRRFQAVVRELKDARRRGEAGADRMPRGLVDNIVTGRFRELDSALNDFQKDEMVGARNPRYRRVELVVSEASAKGLLDLYCPEERELFMKLAERFQPESATT